MAERPVLAILFDPGRAAFLAEVRRRHAASPLILITTPAAASRLAPLADEIWAEGLARGPARFLALVRRIAWARVAHIYDLEGSFPTRFMRFCVWPKPQWHGARELGETAHPARGLS